MPHLTPPLPWLEAGDAFPPTEQAWDHHSDAPGLLAAGGDLSCATLQRAYRLGIFPWFGEGQPILWWSPDPRMVLQVDQFRLHRSLRKTLQQFSKNPACQVRIDTAFAQVIASCAQSARRGAPGTWIVPQMARAYTALFEAGHAHSVETWVDGKLVGGLYCVAMGGAVFGESMFTVQPNASKIALAALVALCRVNAVQLIDCQQNTAHLASLGAAEIPRKEFVAHIRSVRDSPNPAWVFSPLYWDHLLSA